MDRQNRPLTILTIDDEEQIQYALRALFNSQGGRPSLPGMWRKEWESSGPAARTWC